MTRKEEQLKWQELALAYYDERGAEGIKEDIEAVKEPRDISIYDAIKRLIEGGNFAWSTWSEEEDIQGIYGSDYDATRYYNKDGSLKYRGGESWLHHIYVAKMAQAIERIIK